MMLASFFVTRPGGTIVLGVLCLFFGLGNIASPLERPVFAGGFVFVEQDAAMLHIGVSLLAIFLGYGLLKPLRYIWKLYLISAWTGMASLMLNLLRDAKLWEFALLLELPSQSIPGFVSFSRESHALLMALYALTSLYVYSQRAYFWGDEHT